MHVNLRTYCAQTSTSVTILRIVLHSQGYVEEMVFGLWFCKLMVWTFLDVNTSNNHHKFRLISSGQDITYIFPSAWSPCHAWLWSCSLCKNNFLLKTTLLMLSVFHGLHCQWHANALCMCKRSHIKVNIEFKTYRIFIFYEF